MNDSRVAIEVVDGARPRPGLKLMGYTTEPNASPEFAPTESPSDPFPLRLEPDPVSYTHLTLPTSDLV